MPLANNDDYIEYIADGKPQRAHACLRVSLPGRDLGTHLTDVSLSPRAPIHRVTVT